MVGVDADTFTVLHPWKLLLVFSIVLAFGAFVALPLSFVDDYQHAKVGFAQMLAGSIVCVALGCLVIFVTWRKPMRKEPLLVFNSKGVGVNNYPLKPMRWFAWEDVRGIRKVGKGAMSAVVIAMRDSRPSRREPKWLRRLGIRGRAFRRKRTVILVPCIFLGSTASDFVLRANRIRNLQKD